MGKRAELHLYPSRSPAPASPPQRRLGSSGVRFRRSASPWGQRGRGRLPKDSVGGLLKPEGSDGDGFENFLMLQTLLR